MLALLLTTGDTGLKAAFTWPASLKDPAPPLPVLRGLEGLLRPPLWWEAASLRGVALAGNPAGRGAVARSVGSGRGAVVEYAGQHRPLGARFLRQETGFQSHPVRTKGARRLNVILAKRRRVPTKEVMSAYCAPQRLPRPEWGAALHFGGAGGGSQRWGPGGVLVSAGVLPGVRVPLRPHRPWSDGCGHSDDRPRDGRERGLRRRRTGQQGQSTCSPRGLWDGRSPRLGAFVVCVLGRQAHCTGERAVGPEKFLDFSGSRVAPPHHRLRSAERSVYGL